MQTPGPLYLASQSPRRRHMLRWVGIPFHTLSVDVDETPLPGEHPTALATRLARAKALAAQRSQPNAWILSADTVVDLEGESLGKPADAAEARAILRRLREAPHQVHTAVALAPPDGLPTVRRVTTDVTMRPYTDAEIEAYIATGDPMDKAGAYAIQHPEFDPVAAFNSCYANVVGLPLGAVVRLLRDAGWEVQIDVPSLCEAHLGFHCDDPDEGVEV